MPALGRNHAAELITRPVKGFYGYQKAAVDFLLDKSDLKPFYIQKLCKRAVSRILDQKRSQVTLEDVREIYRIMIQSDINHEFEPFWESLSLPVREMVLAAAAGHSVSITREAGSELHGNDYNYGHRVITIEKSDLIPITMFKDWLAANDHAATTQ